jgi:hypothetical protein
MEMENGWTCPGRTRATGQGPIDRDGPSRTTRTCTSKQERNMNGWWRDKGVWGVVAPTGGTAPGPQGRHPLKLLVHRSFLLTG